MDQETKRSIILEHYQNPKNKGLIDDETYIKINMNNDSCIDEVNLMVKLENDKIKDIRCGMKNTSCPDQISKALEKYKKSKS